MELWISPIMMWFSVAFFLFSCCWCCCWWHSSSRVFPIAAVCMIDIIVVTVATFFSCNCRNPNCVFSAQRIFCLVFANKTECFFCHWSLERLLFTHIFIRYFGGTFWLSNRFVFTFSFTDVHLMLPWLTPFCLVLFWSSSFKAHTYTKN